MLQNPIINGLFSIFLVIVVCVLLGLPFEDIIVILILSVVVIFIFNLINEMNKYYNNRINNIENPDIILTRINNFYNKGENKSINNLKIMNRNKENKNSIDDNNKKYDIDIEVTNNNKNNNNLKLYHLQNSPDNIINANKYNLEDCTTDKSCIIPEDENNLYPGFERNNKNRFIVENPINIKINVTPKKLKNNLSIEENVVVENFENNKTPNELNDLVKPFNKTLINPYEEMSILEKKKNTCKKIDENIDDLCRHCKVGECSNGVCVDKDELKYGLLKELPNKIISDSIKDVHPFSSDFQTIRATNPDSSF